MTAREARDETAQGFDVATRDDAPFRASIPARNDVAIEFPPRSVRRRAHRCLSEANGR